MKKTTKPKLARGWYLDKPDRYKISTEKSGQSGGACVCLSRVKGESNEFGTLMQEFAAHKFRGKRVRFSLWIKTENVSVSANAWMRVDGMYRSDMLSFDNMCDRGISGSTNWKEYEIVLDVPEEGTNIALGVMLCGSGKVWIDDVRFDVIKKGQGVTDCACSRNAALARPMRNLNFEEEDSECGKPSGWGFEFDDDGTAESGVDRKVKHSGKQSGFVKITDKKCSWAEISQEVTVQDYLGKKLRMSAWARTQLKSGEAKLWCRIFGDWNPNNIQFGSYDGMEDRPIKGKSDWTNYTLVVDVPKKSRYMWFGMIIQGQGQAWLDDVRFQVAGSSVRLTGAKSGMKPNEQTEPVCKLLM